MIKISANDVRVNNTVKKNFIKMQEYRNLSLESVDKMTDVRYKKYGGSC